jgi:ribosomal protein L13
MWSLPLSGNTVIIIETEKNNFIVNKITTKCIMKNIGKWCNIAKKRSRGPVSSLQAKNGKRLLYIDGIFLKNQHMVGKSSRLQENRSANKGAV